MIAAALGAELVGRADLPISGPGAIESAGPTELTFIRSNKFAAMWGASKAGAALVSRGIDVPGHDPRVRALIVVPDADLALVKLLALAAPKESPRPPGVHPTCIVDPTAKIDPTVHVGPLCIIGAGTVIGPGCVLVARVTVGQHCRLAERTTLHPNVVLYDRTRIGARCTVHAGAVLGADGFGFVPADGAAMGSGGRGGGAAGYIKVPHIGHVEICDDVEIGANSCVDRGKIGATWVGPGTKIDNLVQIAHNVRIGKNGLICGCAGIGGSVVLGERVTVAGHSGIADGLEVGDGGTVAGHSGVLDDIPAGMTYLGTPAVPIRDALRRVIALGRLTKTERKIVGRPPPPDRSAPRK